MKRLSEIVNETLARKKDSSNIPATLLANGRMYYVVAAGLVLLGAVFSVALSSIFALLFLGLLGFILFVLGYLYLRSIKRNGFETRTGSCISHSRLIRIGKGADGFTIQTPAEVVYVPTNARQEPPPIGSKVKVYIKQGSPSYVRSGAVSYTDVYGYEIMPEEH